MPNPKLVFAMIVLVAASAYAGSATVSGCADYAIALGNGPNYDVNRMSGVINSLAVQRMSCIVIISTPT